MERHHERLGAAATDEKASLEAVLDEAESRVACMDPSPGERQLKQLLVALRRIVDSWSLRPPSEGELAFLRARLAEVLHRAKHESPTVRLRRPA